MDWRTVGYEDGVAGYDGSRIGYYRKSCGKFGVTPNLDQYQAERESGLREFCKPANGFRVGARGNGYNGVCPSGLDREFVAAYESGRQLHELRSRVSRTRNELENMHNEINRIDSDLIRVGAEMISPDSSAEHRAQLLLETKQLSERRGTLKADIPQVERDLEASEHDLDAYRATLRYSE